MLVMAVLVAADRCGAFGLAGMDRGDLEGRWVAVASVGVGGGAGPVVRLAAGGEIGLLGVVDAGGRAAAAAAAVAVRRWVGDRPVRIFFARGGTRDAAGRRVAYVDTAAGVRLNERLLARGLVGPDLVAAHPAAERYALLGRQARADADEAGRRPRSTRPQPAGEGA